MKVISTFTLTLILGLCLLQAQPTITNDVLLQVGDTGKVQRFAQSIAAFDPGAAGANVNWDFSSVQTTNETYVWNAVDPSQTGLKDSFPTATLAYTVDFDTAIWTYYYQHDANGLDMLGAVGELNTMQIQDTFMYHFNLDAQMELRTPITYGEVYRDTAQGYSKVTVMGNTFIVDRTVYRSLHADGWGTLQTPAGTYTNVLRTHIREEVVDRLFGQVAARQVNARYSWMSPLVKYELMHMDSLVTLGPLGNVTSSSTFNYYRTDPTTVGIAPSLDRPEIQVSPNPSRSSAVLTLPTPLSEKVQIQVLDLQGKVILNEFLPRGHTRISLDWGNSPAGTYFLNLHGQHTLSSKIITLY